MVPPASVPCRQPSGLLWLRFKGCLYCVGLGLGSGSRSGFCPPRCTGRQVFSWPHPQMGKLRPRAAEWLGQGPVAAVWCGPALLRTWLVRPVLARAFLEWLISPHPPQERCFVIMQSRWPPHSRVGARRAAELGSGALGFTLSSPAPAPGSIPVCTCSLRLCEAQARMEPRRPKGHGATIYKD